MKHCILSAVFLAAMLAGTTSCSEKARVELETYTVERTNMSEVVTATGTMESVTSVDVGTQVTGIIDKLYVDFNDVVEKGQLLAELEKTLLESDLKSADAALASSKATYEYTLANYQRDKKLHDEQLISDYEFQTSQKDYQVALRSYEKNQADRVRAAKNLNYAEIYSPIDGIVVSREVEVGQTVVSSMNVANLYVIADLDNMQVVGSVDEADIGQVKEGQNVTFTVDSYPDEVFKGTVTQVRINPTTTNNVVTYEVIVATANPDHKLLPGMTANLSIYTIELNDAIAVPLKALRFKPENFEDATDLPSPVSLEGDVENSVWVVRDGKLVQTAVTLGLTNGINQQVTSGLKAGDKIAMQYDVITGDAQKESVEENPFMPKPPGAKKDKKGK